MQRIGIAGRSGISELESGDHPDREHGLRGA